MGRLPLPHAKDVRDLLAQLLVRDVDVWLGDPVVPRETVPVVIGTYADEDWRILAAVVCDIELAARTSAAIGLVPVAAAEEAVAGAVLTPMLRENLHEVLNVCAALFGRDDAPHVRLSRVFGPEEIPPPPVSRLVRSLGQRVDLGVRVVGYGTGRLSVVLA